MHNDDDMEPDDTHQHSDVEAWELDDDEVDAGTEQSGNVGYKRPPTGTRFRPGQSGNPSGRPRKPKGREAVFAGVLDLPVSVQKGGRQTTITAGEAVGRGLLAKAAKGDVRAAKFLLDNAPPHSQKDTATLARGEAERRDFTLAFVDMLEVIELRLKDTDHLERELRSAGLPLYLIKRALYPGTDELRRLRNNFENLYKPECKRQERKK